MQSAEQIFSDGVKALIQGDTLSALVYFEKAIQIENSPINCSYLAYCVARERGQFQKAISLGEDAIRREPRNSIHYLNLGRVYLLADRKAEAIDIFRSGLGQEGNQMIIDELNRLGTRKPPVIPFLKRSNTINKYLGIILKKLGLR
ncbi:MAG: tetratricopeptide repeat protein [Nitrospirota bacterium]